MAKDPQTMRAAMRLAQLEEEKTPAIKKTSRLNNPKPYGYLQQAPAPNNSGQGSAKAGSKSGGAATLPTQKLTYQEIRERREKGLCFSYDEKYTTGYRCKNQRMYHLEIAQEDDEDRSLGLEEVIEEEELKPLQLSLNAIEGVVGISFVRLIGNVNGKQVGFLVDMGATHNFIDPRIVSKLQLKVEDVTSFTRGCNFICCNSG